MSEPEKPQTSSTIKQWIEDLGLSRQAIGIGLLVIGMALIVFAVYRMVTYFRAPLENTWVDFVFTLLLGAGLLSVGLWQYLRIPEEQLSEEEATRLLTLAVGGIIGFAVTVLGFCLGWHWWEFFSAGVESWRKEAWRVGATILALFGGLAFMFASLQMARTDERSSATLRRLLYGYNAVLTGLLLLAILLVFNVLTYLQIEPLNSLFAKPSDWTASNIYTLSPATKNLLASIDQPVKFYVLLARRDALYTEVETLMGNFLAENRHLEVEYVSPDLYPKRLRNLQTKYQVLDPDGILIVYGSEPKEEHEFVNRNDLFTEEPGTRKFSFQGESALITKLTVLTEGKARSVVYFAQGDGELDLKELSTAKADEGLGQLKDNLQKANYEVKELRLDNPTLKRIPEDAEIVVIARPSRPLSTAGLEALRAYMNPLGTEAKKGKLVVLLDVVANRDGALVETGLEKLLEEFGVSVGNERILTVPINQFTLEPLRVYVVANPRSRNPVAAAFAQEQPFPFFEARPVSPKSPEANLPTSYSAETIFQNIFVSMMEKPPLHADPRDYLQKLIKESQNDKERAKAFEASLTDTPISVAVGVTSWAPPSGGDSDPHAFMRGGNQQPRMAVFGDASWIANKEITRPGAVNYPLFLSTLSWLRERPNIGKTADPKERKFYTLGASTEGVTRLQWLPGALICLGLFGLGGGIWVVRRR